MNKGSAVQAAIYLVNDKGRVALIDFSTMKEDDIIKKLRKGKLNLHKNEVMNLPDDSSLEPANTSFIKNEKKNETGELVK